MNTQATKIIKLNGVDIECPLWVKIDPIRTFIYYEINDVVYELKKHPNYTELTSVCIIGSERQQRLFKPYEGEPFKIENVNLVIVDI